MTNNGLYFSVRYGEARIASYAGKEETTDTTPRGAYALWGEKGTNV